ncbi:MAG: hypothetical protein FWD82_05090 [Defluviitaleaceae bacterium]|nr:hypothetical protein [Defluviitaleaceae bacterium]
MNCTFLVNSCDKNSDIWVPFFRLLEIHWPDCPYPIVLNTESKRFSYGNFDIKTLSLYSEEENTSVPFGGGVQWGKRLIETLKLIDTEYVLFTLDDYFFQATPDMEKFEQCLEWMDNNVDVTVFYFNRGAEAGVVDGVFPGFEKITADIQYRIKAQMSLWRKDRLISYIMPHESPWDWEINASDRSRGIDEGIYGAEKAGTVFSYPVSIKVGGVLQKGKWHREAIVPLNKTYKLGIDFTKRGFRLEDKFRVKVLKAIINFLKTFLKVTGLFSVAKHVYRKIKALKR